MCLCVYGVGVVVVGGVCAYMCPMHGYACVSVRTGVCIHECIMSVINLSTYTICVQYVSPSHLPSPTQ